MNENEKPNSTVLDRFFEDFKRGDSFLIFAHDHPDPDSISSAAALQLIASELVNARTVIAHGGIVGRAENAHMVRHLKIKLTPVHRIRVDDYSKVALVDTQPRTGNNSCPPNRIPDLVIDHHPIIAPTRRVPFVDVRLEYGATASILTEYLFHFGLEIDRDLATALLYGIKSETQDLGREARKVDIDNYLRLFPLANKRMLAKIAKSRVSPGYFLALQNAIQNAELIGNVIVTRVGKVQNPDMIPEVADLMLRTQGIVWVICLGEYQNSIYLSIRTTNVRKNAGKLMKRLVKGRGAGGGHGLIAGGRVEAAKLEPWQIQEMETEIEQEFLRMIRRSDRPRIPLVPQSGDVNTSRTRNLRVVGS